jgi:signal transduction histidine kinase
MTNPQIELALHERIKELTCLYGISQLVSIPNLSLEDLLNNIVKIIPPAWQYPEITMSRITLDNRSYATPDFKAGEQKISSDILVKGKNRGRVEVFYTEAKPEIDEGPYLKEERKLINSISQQIALIIERKQYEEERSNLSEQLRHADRLATIGQLAAGVAHELNEPLGNMLGFAQLAKKSSGLPAQVEQDIDKIIKASLHAREVVKKLVLFARQIPPNKIQVNLNRIVEEGLYFLEARCVKEGIQLVRLFEPSLPDITADPSQLNQVLVNLVVNAVQAMNKGGRLTIQTIDNDEHVSLVVEDTGIGMSEEVMKHIFIPFFTTKEVGQGTGLGLSVVHGIVASHGGTIKVESTLGKGSRFEVILPKKAVKPEGEK